jgi:hypothetical protein
MTDHRKHLIQLAKDIKAKYPESQSNGNLNQYILMMYKAQTGCKVFKTFAQWKAEGYKIIKGSKGYPVFSRPIAAIKASQGKEASDQESKLFGTAILFNENQVKK